MGVLREAKTTRVSAPEMEVALRSAWERLFGDSPSRSSLLLLVAHWDLETGGGGAMKAFNVGNKKAKPDGSWGDFCFFRTWEVVSAKEATRLEGEAKLHPDQPCTRIADTKIGVKMVFSPNHPYCCFRAYDTLEAGCEDYLRTLKKTFSLAWPAVIAGDVKAFAEKLRAQGYYTAPLADYIAGMQGRFYRAAAAGRVETIVQVQAALATLGFEVDALRGVIGPKTRAGVKAFQGAAGIKVDGDPGWQTKAHLVFALDARNCPEAA